MGIFFFKIAYKSTWNILENELMRKFYYMSQKGKDWF